MSIICPTCGSATPETKGEFLRQLYEKYKNLRRRADHIHAMRMMTGKACDQCIEKAVHDSLNMLDP